MKKIVINFLLFVALSLHGSESKSFRNNADQLPIGTILTLNPKTDLDFALPCGWELCNGQVVEDPQSPLYGHSVPSLNTENLFLRGALIDDDLGKIEFDTIPEHGHKSSGHSHIDLRHTHTDKGHEHDLKDKIPYPVLAPGTEHGDSNGSPKWATSGHYPPFAAIQNNLSKAKIQTGRSQISEGHARVSGVIGGRTTGETRPKNMKYPYIIKTSNRYCKTMVDSTSSIVGWLPSGQQLDSKTWTESGKLNELKVFLRGSSLEDAGEFEMDSMQEHSHNDLGHAHIDRGHMHEDRGHSHGLSQVYDVLRPGNVWGDQNGGPHFGTIVDMDPSIELSRADIQIAKANIQVGSEIIENVIDTKAGSETFPDNIQVVWIEGNIELSPESFPIGTVLAWLPITNEANAQKLPFGWVECNGDIAGVPDINGRKLFLRGGDSDSAGQIQQGQLQNHKHNDLGHKHEDLGHKHIDSGHSLGTYEILVPGDDYGDNNGIPGFAKEEIIDVLKIQTSHANLATSFADIQESKSVIKDVTHAQTSKEVRPKNMGVKFIMKIF